MPLPAKSEGRVKETDEDGERATSKLPPKGRADALTDQVRISVVEAASFFPALCHRHPSRLSSVANVGDETTFYVQCIALA